MTHIMIVDKILFRVFLLYSNMLALFTVIRLLRHTHPKLSVVPHPEIIYL